MNIESLQAVMADDEVAPLARPAPQPVPAGSTFGDFVVQGLQEVNRQLVASQVDLQQLALGEAPSLHAVMTRLEESRIAFQMFLQVRNLALEAFQDVMRMPL